MLDVAEECLEIVSILEIALAWLNVALFMRVLLAAARGATWLRVDFAGDLAKSGILWLTRKKHTVAMLTTLAVAMLTELVLLAVPIRTW